MAVFVTNESASPAVQSGSIWGTTVRFTTAVTPSGGIATPQYSTTSPDMSLAAAGGSAALATPAGTPMFDALQLTLNTGHAKPAFVQIDITVNANGAVGHGVASVQIL
jgi:hypothetical protein